MDWNFKYTCTPREWSPEDSMPDELWKVIKDRDIAWEWFLKTNPDWSLIKLGQTKEN